MTSRCQRSPLTYLHRIFLLGLVAVILTDVIFFWRLSTPIVGVMQPVLNMHNSKYRVDYTLDGAHWRFRVIESAGGHELWEANLPAYSRDARPFDLSFLTEQGDKLLLFESHRNNVNEFSGIRVFQYNGLIETWNYEELRMPAAGLHPILLCLGRASDLSLIRSVVANDGSSVEIHSCGPYDYRFNMSEPCKLSLSINRLGVLRVVSVLLFGAALLGEVSLALIVVFRRIRRHFSDRPGHCNACDYNLTGNTSGICPECGTPIPIEQLGMMTYTSMRQTQATQYQQKNPQEVDAQYV